jgi:hypothetical protein
MSGLEGTLVTVEDLQGYLRDSDQLKIQLRFLQSILLNISAHRFAYCDSLQALYT